MTQTSHDDETPAERLRIATELQTFGIELYRQNLARAHPEWSEQDVDVAIRAWLARPLTQGRPASEERWRRLGVEAPTPRP